MIQKQPLNEIPSFRASKWLDLPVLLSINEMENLLDILPQWIVPLSGVIEEDKELIDRKEFLSLYENYINQIDQGIPRPIIDRRLTCAFTSDLNHLRASTVQGGLLIRIIRPVLQVKPYMLHYSKEAEKFIDSHSQESFAWGLVFSTPQLFLNPETKDVETIRDPAFKALQKWSRTHTIPTPFQIEDKIINFYARIGKTRETPICLPQKLSP